MSHSAFTKCFYSVCFANSFFTFYRLDSVTQGSNTSFIDVNHGRDAAGVAGAQLRQLGLEKW